MIGELWSSYQVSVSQRVAELEKINANSHIIVPIKEIKLSLPQNLNLQNYKSVKQFYRLTSKFSVKAQPYSILTVKTLTSWQIFFLPHLWCGRGMLAMAIDGNGKLFSSLATLSTWLLVHWWQPLGLPKKHWQFLT